jgi:hypothetical protein
MGNLGVAANADMLRGTTHFVMACARQSLSLRLAQQLRQLGDIRRDPPRLWPDVRRARPSVTRFTHYLRVFPQTLLNFFELRQWLCGT